MGATQSPVLDALVPRFGPALRAAYGQDLSGSVVLDIIAWSTVVLLATFWLGRRP